MITDIRCDQLEQLRDWKRNISKYNFQDKDRAITQKILYMAEKCVAIFRWKNLPESVPARNLEIMLQSYGYVIWMRYKGVVYIFFAGIGGVQDQYYRPTEANIANPYLSFFGTFKIDWDGTQEDAECVIMLNDPLMLGLIPMHEKYATQIAENELSIWMTDILSRAPWLLSAQDERTRTEAQNFIDGIFQGKPSAILESAFLDGLKEHDFAGSHGNVLPQLIEYNQYIKANWYNDIGLNALQNSLKKEAISDSEEQMNRDVLRPFIDQMLECRQEGAERVNKFFGLDISVELASAWESNEEEEELTTDLMEAEVEQTEAETEKTEAEADATDEAGDEMEAEAEEEKEETAETEESEETEETEETTEEEEEQDDDSDA